MNSHVFDGRPQLRLSQRYAKSLSNTPSRLGADDERDQLKMTVGIATTVTRMLLMIMLVRRRTQTMNLRQMDSSMNNDPED